MKQAKTAPQGAKSKAAEAQSAGKDPGTQRWPKSCVASGEWFQLPKVIAKQFFKLGIEPEHLLLVLVLQADRYRDRAPRYYWEELAVLCGCSKSSVRRWGYQLQEKHLLTITPVRKRLPGEERKVGYRNARSIFDLAPFEKKLEQLQAAWLIERGERKKPKHKRAAA